MKEPQGAGNGEGLSSAAPFAEGTDEYGLWNALVASTGDEIKAINALNQVARPPFVKKDLGFANAKQLTDALAKVSAA